MSKGNCGKNCEVYSRITGYMRPTSAWNLGKKAEFKDRKPYRAEAPRESMKSMKSMKSIPVHEVHSV